MVLVGVAMPMREQVQRDFPVLHPTYKHRQSCKQADHGHSPMNVDSDMGPSPVFSSSGVAQATLRGVRDLTGSLSVLKEADSHRFQPTAH